jgi:hypothetical protein
MLDYPIFSRPKGVIEGREHHYRRGDMITIRITAERKWRVTGSRCSSDYPTPTDHVNQAVQDTRERTTAYKPSRPFRARGETCRSFLVLQFHHFNAQRVLSTLENRPRPRPRPRLILGLNGQIWKNGRLVVLNPDYKYDTSTEGVQARQLQAKYVCRASSRVHNPDQHMAQDS